jgi:menin
LRDPHCFANLLRFYDGICQWEEGSQTPILHIGWAKQLCFSISKFDYDIRSQIKIIIKSDFDDDNNNKKSATNELVICNEPKNSDGIKPQESTKSSNGELKTEFPMLPSLDELTAACGEKILNPDFLLHGGGVPFSESTVDDEDLNKQSDKKESAKETANNIDTSCTLKTSSLEAEKVMSPIQKDVASPQLPSPMTNYEGKNETLKTEEDQSNDTNNNDGKMEIFDDEHTPKRPIITLKSRKMKGLKDLLLAEKLNTNAISLQITAQSHIGNKKSRSEESTDGSRPKRTRRE